MQDLIDVGQLQNSVSSAKDLIKNVLKGNKPEINAEDVWLYYTLQNMYNQHLIPENPEEYISFDDFRAEGLTGYNPVVNTVVNSTLKTKNNIRAADVENVRVCGNLVREGLFDENKWQNIGRNADAFVLPNKGDLYSLYEFLHILEEKIDYQTKNEPNSLSGKYKPIIAVNQSKIYNELFDYLQNSVSKNISNPQEILLDYFSITLTSDKKFFKTILPDIAKNAVKLNEQIAAAEESKNQPLLIIAATTADKKIYEALKCFNEYGIKVISLTEVIGNFTDALEKHYTYEGNTVGTNNENNSGKAYTVLNYVKNNFSSEQLQQILNKLGFAGYKPVIYINDQGTDIKPEIMAHFDTDNTDFIPRPKFKHAPAAELTYYIQAKFGIEGYYKAINDAMDKAKDSSRVITDVCVAAFVDLNLQDPLSSKIITTCGKTDLKVLKSPKNFSSIIESENFLVPISPKNSLQLAAAEMPIKQYITEFSATGKAISAFCGAMGIEQSVHNKSSHISKSDFKIKIYDGGDFNNKLLSKKLQDWGYNVLDDNYSADRGVLGFETHYLSKADCVIFAENKDSLLAVSRFFEAIVAKQTDPRDVNKALIVYRPSEDLKLAIDLYNQLFAAGYSKEYPPRLIKIANTPEELAHHMNSKIAEYLPFNVEYNYSPVPAIKDIVGRNNPLTFICCSASSERDIDTASVNSVGELLYEMDSSISYGGGDKKMMGQILNAFNNCKKEFGAKIYTQSQPKIVASSTPNLIKKETLNDTMPEGLDHGEVVETIHRRKEFLTGLAPSLKDGKIMPVDLQVILRGGAGTVEEFFHVLPHLLASPENFSGYKMVVDNQPVNGAGKQIFSTLEKLINNLNNPILNEKIVFANSQQQLEATMQNHIQDKYPNSKRSSFRWF